MKQGPQPRPARTETSTNVERAAELLLLLGAAGPAGASLQQLAKDVGGGKSPVHRALAALSRKGFVEVVGQRRGYRLGPAVYALTRQRSAIEQTTAALRPAIVEVAAKTGHSTYLLARAGLDAVCIEMFIGTAPTQTLTGGVGGRIPLGVGPGSISMLATLDEATREAVIENNAQRYRAYPSFDADTVRRSVAETLARGYAHEVGMFLPSGGGVGVAAPQHDGEAHVAISIAAHVDQLAPRQIVDIAATIKTAIAQAISGSDRADAIGRNDGPKSSF